MHWIGYKDKALSRKVVKGNDHSSMTTFGIKHALDRLQRQSSKYKGVKGNYRSSRNTFGINNALDILKRQSFK